METPNYYEERAKKTFSSTKTENENSNSSSGKKEITIDLIKNVAIDAGIAVVGGGAAAAALGQYSFLAGALLTAYAHYEKSDKLRTLGIGLMASSSMTHCAKQDPKASMTDNMQERIKAFGEELKRKLFLDKLMQQKQITKNETKQTDDLKGAEQKKEATFDAQNTAKDQQTKATTTSKQAINSETDYLNADSTETLDSTNAEETAEKKYVDFDLDKILGIEAKLY